MRVKTEKNSIYQDVKFETSNMLGEYDWVRKKDKINVKPVSTKSA